MARRVGIVGIGIMGTAMMRNLVKDGFEVVGYDIAEVAMAGWSRAVGSPPLRRAMLPKNRDPDHLTAQCRCLRTGNDGPGRRKPTFERLINVNLKGTFKTLREAARRTREGGRITN